MDSQETSEPTEAMESNDQQDTSESQPTESISKEDYEAAIKQARDSAYAEARRTFQGKQRQPKQAPTKQRTNRKEAEVDPGAWRDDFQDATCELQLSRGQLKRMRQAFKSELPDDPDSWVDAYCSDFGIGQTETQPQQQEGSEVPDTPRSPSKSDAGAPSNSPVWESPTDPLNWSEDDIARIKALKGQYEGRKFLRGKFNDHMRSVVMKLPEPNKR